MNKKIKIVDHVEYDGWSIKLKDEYVESKEFKKLLKRKHKEVLQHIKKVKKDNEN